MLRITIYKVIILGLAAFLLFACQPNKENADLTAKLDEYLTGESKYFRFNGNVLIAEQGEIIFKKSYGYADFKSRRLLNDSSVFELASISKQFTATAILMLRDQGKLNLTDSLKQYFPELPYHDITIYHMLTHTSGLPEYEYLMHKVYIPGRTASNAEMVSFLVAVKPPVKFPPGTQWEYNNTAYALLASIVEKVSRMAFKDFMAENIFNPLKMKNTLIYDGSLLKDTLANFAHGFIDRDSLINNHESERESDPSFLDYLEGIQGAVAVFSTTGDLLKWDRSVKKNTLLCKITQKEMLEKKALIDTLENIYYGFGVYLNKTDLGNLVYHSGYWSGYQTFFGNNADKDQTVIVLSNNVSEARHLGMALLEIVNGRPIEMPYEHKEIVADSMYLRQFAGKYKATGEFEIQLIENKLIRISRDKPNVELKPESANKFFYGNGTDRQLEFELDSNNKVVKAWLIGYGRKVEFLKL